MVNDKLDLEGAVIDGRVVNVSAKEVLVRTVLDKFESSQSTKGFSVGVMMSWQGASNPQISFNSQNKREGSNLIGFVSKITGVDATIVAENIASDLNEIIDKAEGKEFRTSTTHGMSGGISWSPDGEGKLQPNVYANPYYENLNPDGTTTRMSAIISSDVVEGLRDAVQWMERELNLGKESMSEFSNVYLSLSKEQQEKLRTYVKEQEAQEAQDESKEVNIALNTNEHSENTQSQTNQNEYSTAVDEANPKNPTFIQKQARLAIKTFNFLGEHEFLIDAGLTAYQAGSEVIPAAIGGCAAGTIAGGLGCAPGAAVAAGVSFKTFLRKEAVGRVAHELIPQALIEEGVNIVLEAGAKTAKEFCTDLTDHEARALAGFYSLAGITTSFGVKGIKHMIRDIKLYSAKGNKIGNIKGIYTKTVLREGISGATDPTANLGEGIKDKADELGEKQIKR